MTGESLHASNVNITGYDAVIVGSGPNGLAAAITLAEAGKKVLVLEGKDKIGGGLRSDDHLTLPGFIHDPCSAMHPLGVGSPFFRSLDHSEKRVEIIEVECADSIFPLFGIFQQLKR